MPNHGARKASTSKPVRLTGYALRALSKAGVSYRQSRGGRTTILGRGRPPKSVFPKARFKILRKLTY